MDVATRGGGGGGGVRREVEFLFRDINVSIKNTHILHNISGIVGSGEVLAVMGPSGSGKTTLLNTLGGRIPVESGEVTLDGQPLTKKVRKRMCYVLQQDIFLSKLTLWETLYFAAMVYLPEKLPRQEKLARVDNIIEVLDLTKCRNTLVGDQFIRGLSGGEKKRLSIACELIKDPDIMLMDEPTSGLDSSTAYMLMLLLKRFTEQSGKAVVVTIHQPSSQIFHMFTHLLLMAEGRIAYFGDGAKTLDFFEELDLFCEPHYNPADFILETVKKDKDTVKRITDLAEKKRCTDLWPAKLRHTESFALKHSSSHSTIGTRVHSGDVVLCTGSSSRSNAQADADGDVMVSLIEPDVEAMGMEGGVVVKCNGDHKFNDVRLPTPPTDVEPLRRWATGFWTQFKMLNWRTFKHSRSRIISKYNIINSTSIAIICSLLWFQMERNHETIKDRMAFLFFVATYWSFVPMFDAITSFPGERPVIVKERAAGAYRLSAFYFAKMSSEMPLIVLMPSIFCTLTYWMAGMRGLPQFFATWAILILNVLNTQGIGYIVGAAIWDLQMGITTASILVLYGLLAAGFYVSRLPPWLTWCRYLSIVCYPYNAISILELGDLEPLPCTNITNFELPACEEGSNSTVVMPETILRHYGAELPLHCYVATIAIQVFAWRTVAYLALKYKDKPH
ncbi:uncharacterized protein LOC143288276 [Babylonia areolata]|uniref:uncharacterized protein LOC143288276 n=1 Tax=Babylonia areolata TaxID=304850 RepID=UPI003FD16344